MKFTGAEGAIIEEEERKFFKGNHFSFCFMDQAQLDVGS